MSILEDGLILEARRHVGHLLPPPSLEEVLTSPQWFGLTTASDGQRAICRLAEGLPLEGLDTTSYTSEHAADIQERCTLEWMLNGDPKSFSDRPREMFVLAGIRCGKSLIAAAVAVYASQTVDVRALRPGEKARFSILSLDKDKARAVLMHLYGAVEHSPRVRQLVVGEVRADGVDLRHPSGTIIEIRVTAGKRAGGGLVSYWSAGVVFDEAPRMLGEEEGVVNFEASRKAVLGRLLPGAQLWAIGSPWAPMGPVYRAVESHWGSNGPVRVIRAPGPALNPVNWTADHCEYQRQDEEVYRMDVLGEWGTPEMAMFREDELRLILRDHELPPDPRTRFYAAMDPASRGNAWTIIIGGIRPGTLLPTVYCARQWIPGKETGLSVGDVVKEVAELCEWYGVEYVKTDQWSADAIIELGRMAGITFIDQPWTRKLKVNAFDSLRVLVKEQKVELLNAPQLMSDMLRVKRVLTQDGVTIKFPETADGRHCDYAPAIAMWSSIHKDQPQVLAPPVPFLQAEEERMMADEETPARGRFTFRKVE